MDLNVFCFIWAGFCNSEQPTNSVGIERSFNNTPIAKSCIPLPETVETVFESIKMRDFLYELHISGPVVSTSDIPDANFCHGRIVTLQIFATEKIIIDKDFNSEKKDMTLVLVAPIFDVQGERKIILNGYDGPEHEKSKAKNGRTDETRRGENGEEGIPGGPGGHFHGIAEVIKNRANLTIEANGGKGGPGQNGGDGAMGKNGEEFNEIFGKIYINGTAPGFETILVKKIGPLDGKEYLGNGTSAVVLGKKGTDGGEGGDGGRGGVGGIAGTITLFELNKTCSLSMTNVSKKNGEDGKDGLGGEGGEKGVPGKNAYLKIYNPEGPENVEVAWINYFFQLPNSKGKNGEDGSRSIRNQEPHVHAELRTFEKTFDTFREFMRKLNDAPASVSRFAEKMLFCGIQSCKHC